VPKWNTRNENTFQVELRPDDAIIFRYGERVDAGAGIVGISDGGQAPFQLADLSDLPQSSPGALFERFFTKPIVNGPATVRRFYETFPDNFDVIVFWTNFESDLDDAFASHITVRNTVRGVGLPQFDRSGAWGSQGKLSGVSFLGNINRYPERPQQDVRNLSISTLELLGHEFGHQWLAYVRASIAGAPANALLGSGEAHWSFFHDSDASVMEGNDFAEESPGRFRSIETETQYSSLDLYLMGLAPRAEVAPFYFIAAAQGTDGFGEPLTAESSPERGAVVKGRRRNVLIDDVIASSGTRAPDYENAPKTFREAWIVLYRPNKPPAAGEISKVDAARNAWPGFFQLKTKGRGSVTTTLP
jgi:hypothetical protein